MFLNSLALNAAYKYIQKMQCDAKNTNATYMYLVLHSTYLNFNHLHITTNT